MSSIYLYAIKFLTDITFEVRHRKTKVTAILFQAQPCSISLVQRKGLPPDIYSLFYFQENPEFDVFPKPASGFKAGMKLEAVDPKHPSCICAVSVVETQGARLRLHFDGWSESYDFWTNSDSHLLFPIGFCEKNGQKLHLPRGICQSNI